MRACGATLVRPSLSLSLFLSPCQWKRNYTVIGQVKRQHYQDPQILKEEPIILTHTDVTKSTGRWTMDFLSGQFGSVPVTVLAADDFNFLYYNEKRNRAKYPFNPKAQFTKLPFGDFREKLKLSNASNKKYYMQHYLGGLKQLDLAKVLIDSDGKILTDINSWKWDWLQRTTQTNTNLFQQKHNFTGFMIWIGKPGSVTPTHYDQSHVFLSQVKGCKKVTLFSPSQFCNLYQFPTHHASDRQSQVNFDEPDLQKFPLFGQAQALEAIIRPGEVLFIPAYWWHYVESLPYSEEELTREKEEVGVPYNADLLERDLLMSIRFTFFRKEISQDEWYNKIQLIRTIERLAAEQMGDKKATDYFRKISTGNISEISMDSDEENFWKESEKYSRGIVVKEELRSFVRHMVQGRFEHVPPL